MADGPAAVLKPAEIEVITSTDVDHARTVLNRLYYPIAVDASDGPERFRFEMRVIQLGPLTLGQLSFGAPASLFATELNAYHVTLPTAGYTLARHAGHEVLAGPSAGALFGPGNPVFTAHAAESVELDLKIERGALETELADLLGRPVRGAIDLPSTFDPSTDAGQSWWRLVRLLRDELDNAQSLIRLPLIADRLRHNLLAGLLFAVPHRHYDELTAPAQAGPSRALRRALEAIHDGPERPLGVNDLARIAGMSVRSLQEGFRVHVGEAPMAYLRRVRLDHTRADLLAADPAQVTVTSVAHRWGFAHLGRFSSAYRARFGECPSESLRAQR